MKSRIFNFSLFIFFLLLLFFIVINIWGFSSSIQRPFSLDEAEEAIMGIKINKMGPRTFLPSPEGGGMQISHTLLYTYSHALVSRLFGEGEFPLRMYGVFHYLLSLALLILILNKELNKGKIWGIGVAFVLYITNPLLLQHCTVINADNNILTTTLLTFLYFFIYFEKKTLTTKEFLISRIKLSVLLALCFWAKELTPVFMIKGIILYRLLSKNKEKVLSDLLMSIMGFCLFWFSWWLYCLFTSTDPLAFIKFTFINKSKLAFSSRYIEGVLKGFLLIWRWPIYWVSAPFFIGIAMIIYDRIKKFLNKNIDTIDCILLIALCIWLPYLFFKPTPDMMKYQYPAYPFFIIVLAYYFAQLIQEREKLKLQLSSHPLYAVLSVLLFAVLLLHYYSLGDYILILWQPLSKHLNNHFFVYYYLPILALLSIVLLASGKKMRWGNSLLSLILLTLPINCGLLIAQAQAEYATAEIYLNYGESGLRQTVDYLAQHISPNSTISVRNDLLYHLHYRKNLKIKENVKPVLVLNLNAKLANWIFSRFPIEYLVLDKVTKLTVKNKFAPTLLNKYFTLVAQFGSFYIFKGKHFFKK